MSSAIDFDFSAVRSQAHAVQWQTGQKERLLLENMDDYGSNIKDHNSRIAKAIQSVKDELPYPGDEYVQEPSYFQCCPNCCLRLFEENGANPRGKRIELWSFRTSALCLIASLVMVFIEEPQIRLTREVLLYTNYTKMTQAMRHIHSAYNEYCKEPKFEMDLEIPSWDRDNVPKVETDFSARTGVSLSVNVHQATVSLFAFVLPIYLFSCVFQYARYENYCTTENRTGWYKPWLGPEFSRWLEYLCTSPLQIFIVSSAFGFTSIDTVLAQCGMQAALVLLGYDIEQQVKKIYNRKKSFDERDAKDKLAHLMQDPHALRRFHHLFKNMRLWVYVGVSWALHAFIWISIFQRFRLQDRHQRECALKNEKFRMPIAVELLLYSQFIAFTLFGVVSTWQVYWAIPMDREHQKREWYKVSNLYSLLSVTAKTFLEVGFLMYVNVYKTFKRAPPSTVTTGYMQNATNLTCSAVTYPSTLSDLGSDSPSPLYYALVLLPVFVCAAASYVCCVCRRPPDPLAYQPPNHH